MQRSMVTLLLAALTASVASSAAPPIKGAGTFTNEQLTWLGQTLGELDEHGQAGSFDEGEKLARQRLDLFQRVKGRDHWTTQHERYRSEEWQRLTKVPARQRVAVGRSIALTAGGTQHYASAKYGDALKLHREALAIREKAVGERHPLTASSHDNVADCLEALGKTDEALALYRKSLTIREKALGENHPDTATSYNNVAYCLEVQGKPAEALPLFRKALGIREKTLGEGHPDVARSYTNLAGCLEGLGKASEALPLHRKALAISENALPDTHTDVARCYNNVAGCLETLGRPAEALPLYKKALALFEKALPADHPHVALGLNNVAHCLEALGKTSEALLLYRKALGIRVKVQSENHPDTATCYDNVAHCLQKLGRPAEALPLYNKAQSIREKVLDENHPDLSGSYNNVAGCLEALGKPAEALPLYKKALAACEKSLPKDHPHLALAYNNLACCLRTLGKPAEALPLFEKSLAMREKSLPEGHRDRANACGNVASCLYDLNKPAKAVPLFRKAFLINREALGESHPDTVVASNNLALSLWNAGETARAVRQWQQSLEAQEAVRFQRVLNSGFDRAVAQAGYFPPRVGLAVGLAKLGQPRNAFAQAEASLARGLLDDLAVDGNPDVARLRTLRARLDRLEVALVSFASVAEPTAQQRTQHKSLVREHRTATDELTQLLADDSARRVLSLSRIQKAIPDDAALVLWLDAQERWGCVVRRQGVPLWERLAGSGKSGLLTDNDRTLPARLYLYLSNSGSDAERRRQLSADFVKQLLAPLRPHLKGVKRLFVVPSGLLARVPLEALTDDYAVSYVPSGSVLARLVENRRRLDGSSMLVVGDPNFDVPEPAEPPAAGVLIVSVQSNGNAAKAGLRAGDVLLSIGDVDLESSDDLPAALKTVPAAITFWRDGRRLTGRLAAAPLGVGFDKRSARAAVRAWRKNQETTRGTGHRRLPGTKVEAEAIAALIEDSTLLLGSDASEQKLDDLRQKGELKKYRILHFATHGEAVESMPGRSALILAQDKLPNALAQVNKEQHVYDGRLTVSRIRAEWKLDADLVVLSACETGLGKDAQGDGLLGFSQAFLSCGARAVVVSRWPVDDVATSLLMKRFYENLLGKRQGLKQALGRAEALKEAKDWLRKLTAKEAEKAIESLRRGKIVKAPKGQAKTYEHPFYWAAFTLIGDPD